jgi:hypothetical protein
MNRWLVQSFQWCCLVSLIMVNSGLPSVPGLKPAEAYQGFGASTPGGAGQSVYRVDTLKEDGPGSLREAVAHGYRTVVFEVAGEIKLTHDIWVKGPYLTIDGSTAPSPGIALKYGALLIYGIWERTTSSCVTCARATHRAVIRVTRPGPASASATAPTTSCWITSRYRGRRTRP